jgi:hypothetical protein
MIIMNELEYYTKRLKDPSNTELENILLEIKIKEVKNNECKNI